MLVVIFEVATLATFGSARDDPSSAAALEALPVAAPSPR
jgi:hypothetical protein